VIDLTPAAYHAALVGLQIGDVVPAAIYVADYRDGGRPAWTVVGREALGECGVMLTLVDPGTGDMLDQVGCIVLAFPEKVLRTRLQPHGLTGPAIVGNQLCSLLQQARRAAKVAELADEDEGGKE